MELGTTNAHQICIATDPVTVLRKASRAVTHLYDLVLSPTKVKATQFIILQAIATAGEIAQWRLAQEYAISNDTLSRRLATLRKSGLIQYRVGMERQGERLYRLTDAGKAKLDEALPYWVRAEERLRRSLGSDFAFKDEVSEFERIAEAARAAETARWSNGNDSERKSAAAA